MVIASLTTEDKMDIMNQLEEQCMVRGIATELAIQASEGKKKVEIPPQYAKFKRLFSEEASHRFPPKRAWDHTIEFKPDAPDVINCKVYPSVKKKVSYSQKKRISVKKSQGKVKKKSKKPTFP